MIFQSFFEPFSARLGMISVDISSYLILNQNIVVLSFCGVAWEAFLRTKANTFEILYRENTEQWKLMLSWNDTLEIFCSSVASSGTSHSIFMQICENLSQTQNGRDDWFVNKLEKHFLLRHVKESVEVSCVPLFARFHKFEWEKRKGLSRKGK